MPRSPKTRRKTALVTGASRGIGRLIAERLANEDYDLLLSARDVSALSDLADSLAAAGRSINIAAADMADADQVDSLAQRHLDTGGPLDVLILAAGMGTRGPIDDLPLRRLDTHMAVNVRAPLALVQRLLPALRAAAADRPLIGAKVIAIASITGVVSEPDLAAYGASKAALISLCESITVAEGVNGVTATAISPGYVNTDMTAWIRDTLKPEHMITASDVAELAIAITRLSRYATVPQIVITRPGAQIWRA